MYVNSDHVTFMEDRKEKKRNASLVILNHENELFTVVLIILFRSNLVSLTDCTHTHIYI